MIYTLHWDTVAPISMDTVLTKNGYNLKKDMGTKKHPETFDT